jgi:hypothetical protein
MTKTIENLFSYLHYSGNILFIILVIFLFNKTKKEKALLLIAIYCLIDTFLNYFQSYIENPQFKYYCWSTFTFVEYSIFTYTIYTSIKNSKVKSYILGLSALFIIFTTIFNIVTNFQKIDSIPIGIETILILLFSFYYLYEQTNDPKSLFIYNKYQFWLIIGFMIYLSGSFFVFLYASGLSTDVLHQYWFLTNCFYVTMIILFLVAFYIHLKKNNNIPSQKLRPYLN